MRPPRPVLALARPLGLVLLPCLIAGLLGADDPADAPLRDKGLRKTGTVYVLPAETDVQRKLTEARAGYKQMAAALGRQEAYERELRDGKQMIVEMTQQRIMINRQIAQAENPVQHNQLAAMYNELGDRLNLLYQRREDASGKREVDGEAATRREAYIQQVLDLRQLVDSVKEGYAALAADPDVAATLERINQGAKTKATLGPSRSFAANVAQLEKAEAAVLSESVDLRREGGIFWVDVTFNGKVTRPMAFDTGAADVVLPYDMAAEIGLTPGPDDPIVRCRVADGSIIEARKMVIPAMRVGKFTVKDVSCTVMPAEKKDVPPLLGQTFQKNFLLKFSPDSGKLVLSRVEAPEAAAATASGKGKAGKSGVRRP